MRWNIKEVVIRFDYLVITMFFLIVLISRILFNGLVYGLDFGLFQPDGAYYSMLTLKFLGQEDRMAAETVANWYQSQSYKNVNVTVNLLSDTSSEIWSAIYPRWLYPILSVPFVSIFGMWGMMFIPSISLLISMIYTQKIFRFFNRRDFGLILILVLCSSPTYLRWMTVNYSESLLVALFSILTFYLVSNNYDLSSFRIQLFVLIILTTQTRFCLPIWIAIGFCLVKKNKKLTSILIPITSTLGSLPSILMAPPSAFLPNFSDFNFFEKIGILPVIVIKTIFVELAQLILLDRVLLSLIILSVFFAFKYFRSHNSKIFLATFGACIFLSSLNGVTGVNFRYLLPSIPFLILQIGYGVGSRLR
jgi:hypothetical protein